MSELDNVAQQFLDALQEKRNASGYFFVINEALHPVYFNEHFQPEHTIELAWDLLCDTWLNNVYKIKLNKLMTFIVRGQVKNGVVLWGHNCDYYKSLIESMFKFQEAPEYLIDPSFKLNTIVPADAKKNLKRLYSMIDYFELLPWQVQFYLSRQSAPMEATLANRQIFAKSAATLKARKRLGSMPSLGKKSDQSQSA